jgi:predicted nucleic acid-binding protein
LLVGAGLGSEKAVDAFVVAAADVGGGAVIATVDKEDVEQLAGYATNVRVAMI